MSRSDPAIPLDSFHTFGDLLKYVRRRARLTQREVAIAVGYSEAQISRLEQNQRTPDLAALTALFIPALYLEDEPEIVARLMELGAQARGEELPRKGVITFAHSVQKEILEDVRSVEDNVLNNLPYQLTSFVGRQREIAELKYLLGKAKLVTLTGSGGCGKTRLALETAKQLVDSYQDGIWFIELASTSDPNLVLQTVASTLGVPEGRESQPIHTLTKHLRTKQLLLILDNCEQIVTAAARLAEEMLQTCPQVQILVTSREILNLIGEVQFRVPSLPLSKEKSLDGDKSAPSEAVQLFVERAQAALPSFVLIEEVIPAVTQICGLVDGLPLGIELAAAKITVLSVEQIATRLHNSVQMLRGGRATLPHHQTLEATIQWSYDLLSEPERTLLGRLSVFSGGWTLEAAESVVSDLVLVSTEKVVDLISQLVNKSLIVVEWQPRTEVHYRMLQTIREFASEKLRATGEMERIRSRHFDYFLSLAQEARLFGNEKGGWLDQLEAEHDNLRSALAWSLEAGAMEKGAELILPILDFYWFRGYSTEAREWMDKFLEMESPASPVRALLLQKAGWLTRAGGNFEKADMLLRGALEMALEISDKNRAAWALMDMGRSARDQGDNEQSISFFSQALTFAQESGEKRAIGVCLYNLAESYDQRGELETSRNLWEQGLNIMRMEGDQTHIAWGLEGLAGIAYLAKDFASALKFHLESLKFKVDVMDKLGIAFSFEGLAQLSAAEMKSERAAALWGAANRLREALNVPLESSREDLYTSLIPAAHSQIGAEGFDKAWKKGKEMTLNEAIEFALTPPED
jgi:predicted ATPase